MNLLHVGVFLNQKTPKFCVFFKNCNEKKMFHRDIWPIVHLIKKSHFRQEYSWGNLLKIFNRVTPIDFLQKQPKNTHFQQGYLYRFSSKIAKNNSFSIGISLSIFFKKSEKSYIFNRVNPMELLQKGTFFMNFTYDIYFKIARVY